ncbi:MAG: ATP-dependent DNA ligase, partial [Nakamurella sp.]
MGHVLFIELADASAAVAATRSRLAKRALIAAAIRAAGPAAPDPAAGIVEDAADAPEAGPTAAEPAEIALVVTYLSGSLRQRRTGVGWASLTSIPPPAEEPTLTVRQVDSAFEEIAAIGGQGSAVLRSAA